MASVQNWTETQETKMVLTKAQIKSTFVSGHYIIFGNPSNNIIYFNFYLLIFIL